jgi:CubicO group peptidase (beta-lactamase class C family)
MVSTAEDLARFGIALLHGKLLKREALALMWKPALGKDVLQYTEGEKPPRMSFPQGFGWRLMTDKKGCRVACHCGSVEGFGACLVIYRDPDLVVADMMVLTRRATRIQRRWLICSSIVNKSNTGE